ncbi:MAG: CBS domain-containing protein [Chloroflexi bacterium]|jgi:CBS domain-containing protein|nr:CBS domain-containing protein [Chloroflexota bacterium]
MEIGNILATKPSRIITISRGNLVREAISRLTEHRIGAIIVVDDAGDLCGILSERDIVRWAAKNEDVFSQAVGDVMTKDVVVGVPKDDIMSVAHVMTERRFRHLPIVDDSGKVIGMISIGDVMKAQRDEYSGEIDTLETQIMAGED